MPYDRVKVSKAMDFEISKAEFRDDKFYKDNGIEVLKVSWISYVNIGIAEVQVKYLMYFRYV